MYGNIIFTATYFVKQDNNDLIIFSQAKHKEHR